MNQHQRGESFAGLRAKPQRGPNGGATPRPGRPGVRVQPEPRTQRAVEPSLLLRAFGVGLIAWGLAMITLAVGFISPFSN